MNDDHADLKTSSAPYRAEASEAGNHDGNPKPKKKICCAHVGEHYGKICG